MTTSPSTTSPFWPGDETSGEAVQFRRFLNQRHQNRASRRRGITMVETVEVAALPLAPRNPLPRLQQMKAIRAFHTGCEALRDAAGPVTRLAITRSLPPVVATTSPAAARAVVRRCS